MLHLVKGVTQEMINSTRAKFMAWDVVIRDNVLEDGTDEEKNHAYLMLKDPCIYAYAFFRNPDDMSKPFEMYSYQDVIANDQHDLIQFCAANQIGKSIELCLIGLHFSIHNPGTTTLITSKTLDQSKDIIRQIKTLLKTSRLDYKYDIGETETKTEIYFKHYDEVREYDSVLEKWFITLKELPDSRVVCVPATESALGYAVDLLLVDEEAFYLDGEHIFNQILRPRTYHTKGRIIVFSNPNGEQGIFWTQWNDDDYHHYEFNFLDCPGNTKEEFDKKSKSLTREEIDSTLMARFTSPKGGFLSLDERRKMQEDRQSCIPAIITTPLYIFYDWGKVNDNTVRAIGVGIRRNENDWADEVFVHEMLEYPNGTSYSVIVDELRDLIVSVGMANVAMVGWDNTGTGRGIEDFVKRVEQLGIQAMPVEFSLENKSRIYTLFKLLAEQYRIKIPKNPECDKQLSMLRFARSPRGYLQVHHDSEKDRDDFPDALAGLCSLIVQPDNAPVTVTII